MSRSLASVSAPAGVVDPKTGAIAYANEIMPGWSGVQLGPRLREDLGLPVAVVGDVQAHALGEAHWGVGKGKFSVLCLGIGHGHRRRICRERPRDAGLPWCCRSYGPH